MPKKILVAVIGAVMTILGVGTFVFAQENTAPPEVLKAVAIRNFSPQYVTDIQGSPTGYGIDLLDALASRIGRKIEYTVVDTWLEANNAMAEGRVDIIPNMGITSERQEIYDFSQPVERIQIRIFVNTGSPISGIEDLKGKRVAVVETNAATPFVSDIEDVKVLIYDHQSDAITSLLAERVDALVYPEEAVYGFLKEVGLEKRVHAVGVPVATILRGIAVRKGDHAAFIKAINDEMAVFSQTNDFFKIYSQWHANEPSFWTTQRVILLSGGLLGLIIFGMLWWRYRSMRHITLRLRKALKDAVESKLMFQGFIESAPNGILVLDPNLSPSYWNTELEKLLDLSSKEILAESIIDFFTVGEDKNLSDVLRELINVKSPDKKVEAEMHTSSGKKLTVEISISREVGPSSEIFILSIHDITLQNKMFEDLIEKNKELERISKLIVGRESAMIALKSKLKAVGLNPDDAPLDEPKV